jgi:hypothetical protein
MEIEQNRFELSNQKKRNSNQIRTNNHTFIQWTIIEENKVLSYTCLNLDGRHISAPEILTPVNKAHSEILHKIRHQALAILVEQMCLSSYYKLTIRMHTHILI